MNNNILNSAMKSFVANEVESSTLIKQLSDKVDLLESDIQSIKSQSKVKSMLTKDETCKLLRITVPTLDKLTKNGKLTPSRNGKRVTFDYNDVTAYIENSKSIKHIGGKNE